MYSPAARKLKELMDHEGISESELSRRSKVTQPTIHRILTGESVDPRPSNLTRLANYFGVPVTDFLPGNANKRYMRIEDAMESHGWNQAKDLPDGDFVFLHQLNKIKAGKEGAVDGEWPAQKVRYPFRTDWIKRTKPRSMKHLMVMQITNNSMAPYIQSGDAVLLDIKKTRISNGQVYAIIFQGKTILKRLYRQGSKTILSSDNKTDPANKYDLELSGTERSDLEIIGQVVWRGG